ncbi:hypothetical protein SNEBB_000011 [Seison nebaliae]|nr:hypothetical protein SNEBB_000011 [Seison nebaliae]
MGEDDDHVMTEDERRARKKAERERKRREAREKAEKKKKFGLTPEKKKKLRILIMQKATEDLKNEALKKLEAKKYYIQERVKALPDLTSMNEASLVSLAKEIHSQIKIADENKYDIEFKVRKNDYEINEQTIKVNDVKGKFIKPTLKKISKTQGKFLKMQKLTEKKEPIFDRNALKSSGKKKFELEEEETKEKVDFREQLKSAKDEGEVAE